MRQTGFPSISVFIPVVFCISRTLAVININENNETRKLKNLFLCLLSCECKRTTLSRTLGSAAATTTPAWNVNVEFGLRLPFAGFVS